MTIKRFFKNLSFNIKQKFCEVTLRLNRGSESRTKTYDAPCILMFLAKIKGHKVHFWKLVTFFWEGGVYFPLPTP